MNHLPAQSSLRAPLCPESPRHGRNRCANAVAALIAALRDPNAGVRSQAAWALGLKGDARSVEPLRNALNDPDASVRKQARWALDLRDLKMGKRNF